MNTNTQLNHLARVQDQILDILADTTLNNREIRARLTAIYPDLAAVVDHLVAKAPSEAPEPDPSDYTQYGIAWHTPSIPEDYHPTPRQIDHMPQR